MPKTFKQMTDEAMADMPGITPQEAYARQQAEPNALLINVLDLPGRRALGEPLGSLPIPGNMLPFRADHAVPERHQDARLQDRSRPIMVVCGGGPLSAISAQVLKEMGFSDISYVAGGTRGWQAADLPMQPPTEE